MTLTIDPNIADCGMMDNVHAERKAASLCSSPNSQHCSQFSKQKVLKFSQIERKSRFQRPIKTRKHAARCHHPSLPSSVPRFPEIPGGGFHP